MQHHCLKAIYIMPMLSICQTSCYRLWNERSSGKLHLLLGLASIEPRQVVMRSSVIRIWMAVSHLPLTVTCCWGCCFVGDMCIQLLWVSPDCCTHGNGSSGRAGETRWGLVAGSASVQYEPSCMTQDWAYTWARPLSRWYCHCELSYCDPSEGCRLSSQARAE